MKHPVHDLLNKLNPTPDERIAIYALMLLSTDQKYEKLTVEALYDQLLLEYEQVKQIAAMEGVPQDNSNEIDPNTVEREQKIDNLLMIRPVSKLRN